MNIESFRINNNMKGLINRMLSESINNGIEIIKESKTSHILEVDWDKLESKIENFYNPVSNVKNILFQYNIYNRKL